jgi:bacterioferritin-associated ferredoxin
MKNPKKGASPIVCRCNNVSEATLHQAIQGGCKTMNEIFDQTTAGVGPCGGSCRRKIQPMLEGYLQTGAFPSLNEITKKISPTGKK